MLEYTYQRLLGLILVGWKLKPEQRERIREVEEWRGEGENAKRDGR